MTEKPIPDYMAILLDKQAMAGYDFAMNITLADLQQQYMLRFKNGVVLVFEGERDENAEISLTTAKNALLLILNRNAEGVAKNIRIEGDASLLDLLMQNLNAFDMSAAPDFNIIEP